MESPAVQKNKTECKMAIRNEEPHVNKCFPRIRGDVPYDFLSLNQAARFSPHPRGCSAQLCNAVGQQPVFPAYAGMFPPHSGDG